MNFNQNTEITMNPSIIAKIQKIIETEASEEFKQADKLVSDNIERNNEIKEFFKNNNITATRITMGSVTYIFQYNLKNREKFDISMMPDELKAPYLTKSEIWIRNISVESEN